MPQSIAKAIELYEQAAEKGCAGAMFNLGLLYMCMTSCEAGEDPIQNLVQSKLWFTQAAARGERSKRNRNILALASLDAQNATATPEMTEEDDKDKDEDWLEGTSQMPGRGP